MNRDTLIHKVPKGEFETLVWERHMNKELSKEMSKIKKENKILETKLVEIREEMENLLVEMRKTQIRALIVKNKKLKEIVKTKNKQISELKKNNEDIFRGYIRLQQLIRKGLSSSNIDDGTSEDNSSTSPLNP